jgi:hypothetical protein
MKSLLLHVPIHKMPNLLNTYKTYIEYIEEASFCGLTMRSSALERHPTESGDPCTTLLCLDPTCNYSCSSYEDRHKVDLPYGARGIPCVSIGRSLHL